MTTWFKIFQKLLGLFQDFLCSFWDVVEMKFCRDLPTPITNQLRLILFRYTLPRVRTVRAIAVIITIIIISINTTLIFPLLNWKWKPVQKNYF